MEGLDQTLLLKIKTGLNYHGDIFRQVVRNLLLQQIGTKLVSEELPIDRMGGVKIDLVFEKHVNGTLLDRVVLLIECKKVHSSDIKWLFLEETNSQDITSWLARIDLNNRESFMDRYIEDFTTKRVLDGYKLDLRKSVSEDKILIKDNIEDVLRQITLQFAAYFLDFAHSLNALEESTSFNILPIIVTNAELLIVKKYPINRVDKNRADVSEDDLAANTEKVGYVLAKSFGNVSKTGDYVESPSFKTLKEHAQNTNKGVYIVNVDAISKFFNEILN